MSRREAPLYRRGKYWLAWDRKADGSLRSPFLAIFWYDPAARRTRSASTGTAEVEAGVTALDRRYLADRDEAPAYCHACGQPFARADAYLLSDAISDYRLEKGDERSSADSIVARLKHVLDFLEAESAKGAEARFGIDTSCAIAVATPFAEAFRAWSRAQPVVWRNGEGVITTSRPRAPATTEESIIQLAAVLNHAADTRRSNARPEFKPLPRRRVSRPRRIRAGVDVLARFAAYAAEEGDKRSSLRPFLVASICTLARPDAIVDISIAPHRKQWWPGSTTLDLNPLGRSQTKKFRPVVPVMPLLEKWLSVELTAYEALEPAERAGRGWLVSYFGRPVKDVHRTWSSMLESLGMPADREWMPYVLRHSLATLVRNRGVGQWELAGYMGHRAPGQTETYAVGEYPNVIAALGDILEEIDLLAPGALHRSSTGTGSSVIELRRSKMTG
ncbi:site-specific integrase [Sphingomonas hengshuiensis]|uniref:hypothetical protein n=1 Tax=Sphingomonas hengshuiensis TaxID=1609977 RepID=UPI0005CA91EF|nr:hypothetical protein [Sphingomonas hengshuiensis]